MDSITEIFGFISVAIIVIIGASFVCASPTLAQSDDKWGILLDRIALGEGTSEDAAKQYGFKSGYDILYGYNEPEDFDSKFSGKSLTELTLGEIWELQTKMGRKNAVGRYQILSDTLFGTEDNGYYGLQDILGLSDDTLFDASTQERLAQALLERRSCSDWMEGDISDSQFQLNLAQEWASVADPNTGTSYYGQNVGTTDAEIKEAMRQTKAKQATSGSQQIAQDAIETSQKTAVPSSEAHKSTIPIPTGSSAEALKKQGKYAEYMQNALQAAERRIEQDPKDREAWYAKGLALYYLNRGPEADEALAKAGDLGIQFEFDGESFFRESPDSSPSIQQSSPEAHGESVPEEESIAPKFYPTTSTLSDEDVLSSISRGLEPITQSITSSQSQSISKDFLKGDKVETTDLLNVRSVPGLPIDGTEDTRISEPMSKGSMGTILEGPVEADGFAWWKIQYDDGTIGWSQDKRLELQPTSSQRTSPSAGKEDSQSLSGSEDGSGFGSRGLISPNSATVQQQTLGERAVQLAKSVEGAEYKNKKGEYSNYELMDSETVKEEGIDCSGLVFWAFNKAADVSTWRPSLDPSNDVCPECVVDRYGADGQWNDEKMWAIHNEFATPPSETELKSGDLLYVNTADRGTVVDHVGIYAGDGKVLHSTSGGVKEISYDEWKEKYGSSFFGYGRVKGAEDAVLTSDLGGIDFASINLNFISINPDQDGGLNLDLVLKAQKSNGTSPGIDILNSTKLSAIAFMTGLAIPDYKFEASLDPNNSDRIIDKDLAQSEVGRIMLEADLQMKKDFAKYGTPCESQIGKVFYDLLDKKEDSLVQRCMNEFPGEIKDVRCVRFRPISRHNIVPDKIYAYTNETQIYIINASLKIISQSVTEDSFFDLRGQDTESLSFGCLRELNESAKEFAEYYNELTDEMIAPYVVADVNHAKQYEDLRNVYVALALAQWYNRESRMTINKNAFREDWDSSTLISTRLWSPKEIWNKYIYSYRRGEYKCWKNETIKGVRGISYINTSKSSGGVTFGSMSANRIDIGNLPSGIEDKVKKAVAERFADEGNEVLFGNRIHVNEKKDAAVPTSAFGSSSESTNLDSIGLTDENVSIQERTTSPVGACPEGWMGPDKNGECWQMQIIEGDGDS